MNSSGAKAGSRKPPAERHAPRVSDRESPGVRRTRTGIEVAVVDRQRIMRIGGRWLGGVVRKALVREGIDRAVVSVVLVDDRRIAALHRTWLGVPDPTDVITFDLSAGEGGCLEGDIAVSTETALRVARELGWHPRQEVAYYAIHGLLHLAGYDDLTAADRRAMRARERVLLAAAGLPPPPRTERTSR